MNKVIEKILSAFSGTRGIEDIESILYNKIIGFKGCAGGEGVSTIVQNVAIALAVQTKLSICVVDTNIMYPMQYTLLGGVGEDLDIFDYTENVKDIIKKTKYSKIDLVHVRDTRHIPTLLGSGDTEMRTRKLYEGLKEYYDIILVDLSKELTHLAVYSGILCNQLYLVTDSTYRNTYHLDKTINTLKGLGVATGKIQGVVVNKGVEIETGVGKLLEKQGLPIICSILYSSSIAEKGVVGKAIYGDKEEKEFVLGITAIVQKIMDESTETKRLLVGREKHQELKQKPNKTTEDQDFQDILENLINVIS